MTFSRSWPNTTSLRKTTEQHSSRMMTSLLQAISSQCQRVIHFKLNSMHLERESNITITALAEKNVETILLHEIIMNNFNRDLIENTCTFQYIFILGKLRLLLNRHLHKRNYGRHCVDLENIRTPPTEGIGNSRTRG